MVNTIKRQVTVCAEDVEIEVYIEQKENVHLVVLEELPREEYSHGIDLKISAKDELGSRSHLDLSPPVYDKFTIALYKALNEYNKIEFWEVIGKSGIGSRHTMSMNIKRNNDIGHPNSIYIWDIIAVAENCFDFFDWSLIIGDGYLNSARDTAAQSERIVSDKITTFQEEMLVEGPVVYLSDKGEWEYSKNSIMIKDNDIFPFGPIALQVHGYVSKPLTFPFSMFTYLINTLERGEEPMEVVGRDNYSAVSGWKAFARWMQSLSVPVRGMINPYQDTLAKLLFERRQNFTHYLQNLASLLSGREQELISELARCYNNTLKPLSEMVKTSISMDKVRRIYFAEQTNLPTYKLIRNYIKQPKR